MQSRVPYPKWRSSLGYRNDQLAAQDRQRSWRETPCHRRMRASSNAYQRRWISTPPPQRQRRSTGCHWYAPETSTWYSNPRRQRIADSAYFFFFENRPVLQMHPRPDPCPRGAFRPILVGKKEPWLRLGARCRSAALAAIVSNARDSTPPDRVPLVQVAPCVRRSPVIQVCAAPRDSHSARPPG